MRVDQGQPEVVQGRRMKLGSGRVGDLCGQELWTTRLQTAALQAGWEVERMLTSGIDWWLRVAQRKSWEGRWQWVRGRGEYNLGMKTLGKRLEGLVLGQ